MKEDTEKKYKKDKKLNFVYVDKVDKRMLHRKD